jgi:hypothetical protein
MGKETIAVFDPYADPDRTGLLWKAWRRNFGLYLESKEIGSERRKLAKLLFLAGPEVQRIYEQEKSKKDEESDSEGEVDSEYVEAVGLLDRVFLKQNNEPYQRTIFRQTKQKSDETVAPFIGRLREQAQFCNFGDASAIDKAIKDQIIAGAKSDKLRREMLKRERSIQEITALAQSIENVEQYEKANKRKADGESVNEVQAKRVNMSAADSSDQPERRCWACNRLGHSRGDTKCPAKGKKCLSCHRTGHFSICCNSRPQRKGGFTRQGDSRGKGRFGVRAINEFEPDVESTAEYIFHIGGTVSKTVMCVVGGVEINVLIDSGTRRNLIPVNTWERMKREGVKTRQMHKGSDVSFKAYGQSEVIPVRGRFEAEVELNGKKSWQWFYVVEKGDVSLLGEDTSVAHGVLQVKTTVNAVESETFPKIKGNSFMEDW